MGQGPPVVEDVNEKGDQIGRPLIIPQVTRFQGKKQGSLPWTGGLRRAKSDPSEPFLALKENFFRKPILG